MLDERGYMPRGGGVVELSVRRVEGASCGAAEEAGLKVGPLEEAAVMSRSGSEAARKVWGGGDGAAVGVGDMGPCPIQPKRGVD